jgi:3-hydroxybutyrate dehydrogenase
VKEPAAIVTGAASGIGRAIAMDLAAKGARVLFADVNVEEGERVAADFPTGAFQRADTAKQADCDALVARAVRDFGGVDILVNNAGLQHVAPVEEFPVETWEGLIRIMLFGAFYLTRAALPHMYAKGWGRIVNIASVHGLVASPYKSAYVAAKHGLVGFTKAVALEAAEKGVTVNAVCPSYVRTPLVERQIGDQARVHHLSEADVVGNVLLERSAIKRLIEPAEVAEAIAYLCGPSADFVTGTNLVLDGGWTAH